MKLIKEILPYTQGSIVDTLNSHIALKHFDLIYINLWNDRHTFKTPYKSLFKCKHKLQDKQGQNCLSCKAYLKHIGQELLDIDYYQHIFQIQSKLKYNQLVIKTNRYYPDSYHPLNINLKKHIKAKYNKTYIVLNKEKTNIDSFVIHYTQKKRDLKKNHLLYQPTKTLDWYNKNLKDVLVINPDLFDLLNKKDTLNVISNKRLLNFIEKI